MMATLQRKVEGQQARKRNEGKVQEGERLLPLGVRQEWKGCFDAAPLFFLRVSYAATVFFVAPIFGVTLMGVGDFLGFFSFYWRRRNEGDLGLGEKVELAFAWDCNVPGEGKTEAKLVSCTSEARKIGEAPCAREGAEP